MKKDKIIYWISTILIFLFEGVMPALTSQTEMAKEGIRHLGYPGYFGIALTMFKVAGSIILVVPKLPSWLKKFAYAGFVYDFVFASISHTVIDGVGVGTVFPFVVLAVLGVSYFYYQKLQAVVSAK
ncbi:MAG: DoxX family protein [Sphingobacteriia bacterium]|nr:DoxX family protein [Sphingobacteriia bacterium]